MARALAKRKVEEQTGNIPLTRKYPVLRTNTVYHMEEVRRPPPNRPSDQPPAHHPPSLRPFRCRAIEARALTCSMYAAPCVRCPR